MDGKTLGGNPWITSKELTAEEKTCKGKRSEGVWISKVSAIKKVVR
jgi:hypothetical protein